MTEIKEKLYMLIGELVVETRILKVNYCGDEAIDKNELSKDVDTVLENAAAIVREILADCESAPIKGV